MVHSTLFKCPDIICGQLAALEACEESEVSDRRRGCGVAGGAGVRINKATRAHRASPSQANARPQVSDSVEWRTSVWATFVWTTFV
ncbi:hypothetical protein J6590_030376 [Homalodisca vitripennis]|nr:hypothetical protein J6590_030376 [Homalodisca vitripennis]